MRALVQRVAEADVSVDGEVVGQIGAGLLIFVCAMPNDDEAVAGALAAKIAKLRIFGDAEGRMNRSLIDIGGSALVVSQFTLAADTSRGNRPGFSGAAPPELGEALYRHLARTLENMELAVATGVFGADMNIRLVNAGPVTIWLDTEA